MSGSKYSSISIDEGAEVIGAAILATLAIPAGAMVLTYYVGKVLVAGTVAGGQMAAEGIEHFQEYQRQQNEIHRQQMENRRVEACANLCNKVNQVKSFCNQISTLPFKNDPKLRRAVDSVNNLISRYSSNLTLDKAIELNLKLDKAVESVKERQKVASRSQQEQSDLMIQMEQTRKMLQSQSDIPSALELAKLDEFRNRINSSTIETFPNIKAEVSNWIVNLMDRIKSVQESEKIKRQISSLWNSLPVGQEASEKYDSSGFYELKRMEAYILSDPSSASETLSRFQKAIERHKAVVEVKMRQEAELEAEREKIRSVYEPKLDEMAQKLELADNEIVKRWERNKLANLKQTLRKLRSDLVQGIIQTMDFDIEAWNKSYTDMLTQAGLKQQAEERRQYLVNALKTELPQLGFDIQSLSSKSDSASDTIIKIVPRVKKSGRRQRITITVPQAANKPVNYTFDDYELKCSRIQGQPVVENDTGKQTVQNIASALKPYGIVMSEPDWPENPDKIRKNEKNRPDDNNPAVEQEQYQSAQKYRSLDFD